MSGGGRPSVGRSMLGSFLVRNVEHARNRIRNRRHDGRRGDGGFDEHVASAGDVTVISDDSDDGKK